MLEFFSKRLYLNKHENVSLHTNHLYPINLIELIFNKTTLKNKPWGFYF